MAKRLQYYESKLIVSQELKEILKRLHEYKKSLNNINDNIKRYRKDGLRMYTFDILLIYLGGIHQMIKDSNKTKIVEMAIQIKPYIL